MWKDSRAMPPQRSQVTPAPRNDARTVLAVNLVKLRNAKGWSQEALAFECGLHRTFVAHVERRVRNISLDNLEKLALALDVPIHSLLVE
jgi:transcriptional regulator with XRE-family HTH domain